MQGPDCATKITKLQLLYLEVVTGSQPSADN